MIAIFQMTDTAGSEAKSTATNKVHREEDSAQDSEAMKQIATLVTLMRQQMEWTKRSDDSKREQQIGAAEALEIRMRKMEVDRCPDVHTFAAVYSVKLSPLSRILQTLEMPLQTLQISVVVGVRQPFRHHQLTAVSHSKTSN